MLHSMEDGEINVSAYDTAWVALVEDIHGNGGPQFPSSLQWIVDNQLNDGSWGEKTIFSAHDRILNTLGCVVALKTWNLHSERCEKGMSFIHRNMNKLGDENEEHMPIGFEVIFPSLIEIARKLDLEIPDDSPAVQKIYAQRKLKLKKIPMDMVHMVPTTLLYSLEGMEGLDWEKLIKLQSSDGSFLFSPSSTAFAFMKTKDEKCLEYLNRTVKRFNGGAPNAYPVDLFEHLWSVDRLERLGVSRFFQSEIEECVNYVSRYWSEAGMAWARHSSVRDIDDTAMAFRILRLHGHDVSPDIFQNFEKSGEFFCFAGQSNQAITGMFNLYRASQMLFPGEAILEDAKQFAYKFLRGKQASGKLLDKWIITKDLPGEVGYALDIPWYVSLPRIETRFYLEQYGGKDDVWIGKTIYRMSYVNNDTYLNLAKLDFNNCQALHQLEWNNLQEWYTECNLIEYGVENTTLLETYFVAAASIYAPERSTERIAWTKASVLVEAIISHFEGKSKEQRVNFVNDFISLFENNSRNMRWNSNNTTNKLVHILRGTLSNISMDTLMANGKDVHNPLHKSVEKWLLEWKEENDSKYSAAEMLVRIISLCGGHSVSQELLSHPQYKHLLNLTNKICYQLGSTPKEKINGECQSGTPSSVDSTMQELVQTVLKNTDEIKSGIKKTFLIVAKSYFYKAYCSQETMEHHIAQVLFNKVD
ncbi:muconate cycloisomerase [Ranunculus cassubicifolius]